MSPATLAAHEINEVWRECVSEIELATCPSDEDVAAIITKYFPLPTVAQNDK